MTFDCTASYALALEPDDSLELAIGYVRSLDYYNIHADNLVSFVVSLAQVPAEAVDAFVLQGRDCFESLCSEEESLANQKVTELFEAVSSHGLSPVEANELNRLLGLFVEFAKRIFVVEAEVEVDLERTLIRPSRTLGEDLDYLAALEKVNIKAANLFFFIVGEEELSPEIKDQIAFCISEYYRAVRSWVFADIFITKGDIYSLGSVVSVMDNEKIWALKEHLDEFAGAALELEEAENKAFDKLPRMTEVQVKPWQS